MTSLLKIDNAQPNRYLVASVVYDTPKLNVNRGLGYIVNGWKWSHSLNWQSGTTVNLPSAATTPGSTGSITGLLPTGVSPVTHHQSLAHWFNTCYISLSGTPTNCQYGEQPAWIQQPNWTLNQINGNPIPGVRLQQVPYYDMALMKSIPIREDLAFSLRVDAHNVFNMALLGQGPGNSLTSSTFGANSPAATVNGNPIYPQVNDPRILRLEARLSF